MKTNKHHTESGQALILIVIALAGLIGLTALAVDGGHVYATLRQAQNAADTASFAAAVSKINGGNLAGLQAAGQARAASNGFTNGAGGTEVIINNPPDSSAPSFYANNGTYVQAIINAQVPTFFARVVGVTSIPIHVQAVAKALPGEPRPVSPGNGIVGLGDDCGTVQVGGNGTLDITGAGIFSNSHEYGPIGGCYAFIVNGSSSHLSTPGIDVVGCIKPADIPYIELQPDGAIDCSVDPIPYPMPVPAMDVSCTTPGTVSAGIATPGNWSGTFPPAGTTTLLDGIYCIHGNFKLTNSDDLHGDGLLFVVDGDVDWTGGKVRFTPYRADEGEPRAANLLVYAPYKPGCDPAGSTNRCHIIKVNGGTDHQWNGTIFGPDSKCTVNGESNGITLNAQVICYDVLLNGNGSWDLSYDAGTEWQFPFPPETELNR